MAIQILMPALSPTMTEGKLAKWHIKVGDTVASGDVIAEIETDKAIMEVEAVEEGKVHQILVAEGSEGVAVNAVIAVLAEEGETPTALSAAAKADAIKTEAKPEQAAVAPQQAAPQQAAPQQATAPQAATPKLAAAPTASRLLASPLARRLAEQAGLNLSAIKGSGPYGRIVKRDIEAAQANKGTAPVSAQPSSTVAAPALDAKKIADAFGLSYQQVANSGMRKTIAARLTQSKQTVPHFRVSVDCQLDKLLALRSDINASLDGEKISVNDFIIKAAAIALKQVPKANASWAEEGILYYDNAHISVAVAIPDGLITPIVRMAEQKSLLEISREVKTLAAKAKEGKLKPQEYQGGTFSVSNLGMYGIQSFDAIINPPEAAIMAIGAGEKRPVVAPDGTLVAATVMSCNLSCDHRVIDGAIGAEFMAAFKALIEAPLRLLVGS